jgi:2-oxoglutarate dehydrogenase E2 component (dihydrolipoamide succinyltransferase)
MGLVDLIMPKLGESIMEATILKWHKRPGDSVKEDETVLDIATDKVDSEVPSTYDGIIEELMFQESDVVPIGSVIAKIRVPDAVSDSHRPAPTVATPPKVSSYEEEKIIEEVPYQPTNILSSQVQASSNGNKARFYSPLVLNIAAGEGISLSELENIPGTGQDGRVSKKDILSYVANKRSGHFQSSTDDRRPTTERRSPQPQEERRTSEIEHRTSDAPATIPSGNVEIIEMDRMRKLIAKHMVDSKNISAHVTSFAECDVTTMVQWRERIKKDFEKREGEKITFTPLFIEAIVKSIKKYPMLSSSLEGDKIIIKKDLNIGMAAALPDGNLIVPVIKNADQLNLSGLTKQVNHLANAARSGKLKPDDTTGGTFTLSNIGTFGSIMGTPIINQPQVAIMAIGTIKKRPAVIETAQGDSIAIRHMMYISLSYDHRIIDGALGSIFLHSVAKELENFDINREI